jgi:putative tryptophan/tyrosine transport system substrate-binding protein
MARWNQNAASATIAGVIIRRRNLILMLAGGPLLTWPHSVAAQRPSIIGFLSSAWPESYAPLVAAFCRGLGDTGRVEGEDVAIEYRWARGQYDRLPALAADLVSCQASVIIASGGDVTALAAKALTSTIPIVFADGVDPVSFGLVASLERPQRNITGVRVFAIDREIERLNLLHELVPRAAVVAMLVNPENPILESDLRALGAAAEAKGSTLFTAKATSERDFERAFARIAQLRAAALLVAGDALFNSHRDLLTALAARHAIPALYAWREFAAAGGLMSYGPNLGDAYHQAGTYAGKILGGAKPADMPVAQSANVELVMNVKAAITLGLKIPASVLARAEKVID